MIVGIHPFWGGFFYYIGNFFLYSKKLRLDAHLTEDEVYASRPSSIISYKTSLGMGTYLVEQ